MFNKDNFRTENNVKMFFYENIIKSKNIFSRERLLHKTIRFMKFAYKERVRHHRDIQSYNLKTTLSIWR